MSDWLTIRVVLEGTDATALAEPPGRILLAHADHTFADLAEAIDLGFARWDLGPLHEFRVEGRMLLSGGDEDDPDAEDSDDVTLGEVGLRAGDRFSYVFDLGEGWEHACAVEELDVDPVEEYGDEPDGPVPVYGWGTIPDQYWRVTEDDEGADDGDGDAADGDEEDDRVLLDGPGAWEVAERFLVVDEDMADPSSIADVARTLRAHENDTGWPYGALLAAAGLDAEELPGDDETLWVEVAAGVVSPADDLPVQPAEESAWTAMEPADWVALVIELLRPDAPAAADAQAMLDMIKRCPEVEQDLSPADEHGLLRGLDLVRRLLETLGALDADGRATAVGHWGLPRALERGLLAG